MPHYNFSLVLGFRCCKLNVTVAVAVWKAENCSVESEHAVIRHLLKEVSSIFIAEYSIIIIIIIILRVTVTHIRSADSRIHTTETNSFAHSLPSTRIKQLQYNSHNILNPSPPFPREIDSPAQVRQYLEEF